MTICHASDIHFRNSDRMEDFKKLSENFIELLKKEKPDRVVLTGDIFHLKTILSPEVVHNVFTFFLEILKIAPIDLIDGNHDLNPNNKKRMGSLDPIVTALEHIETKYRITHYTHSGLFPIFDTNIVYGVFSLRDDPKQWPLKPKREDGKIYIALYHGTISGSVLESGQELESLHTIDMFNGYDLALLGDIHLRQHLNAEETISYPGSPLHQDYGESGEKGFLMWNLDTLKSKFVPIPNEHTFITVRGENLDEALENLKQENVTPHSRVRIQVANIVDNSLEEECRIALMSEYGLKAAPDISSGENQLEQYAQEYDESWLNYTDTNNLQQLILTWLRDNEYGEAFIEACIKIHNTCMAQISAPYLKNNTFRLRTIHTSNFGIHDEDNFIDLKQVKGIIGIFAPNRSGKSTLLEAINFALFGDTMKNLALADMLNYLRDEGFVEVELELNGIIYKIKRSLTRRKGGVASSVSLHFLKDGEWEEAGEDTSTKTSKKIITMFGTQEDMLLSAITPSEDLLGMIKFKQTDRLKTLNRFANISFLTDLNKAAKTEIANIEKLLGSLEGSNNSQEFERIKSLALKCEQEIEEMEKELKEYSKELETIQELIALEHQKIKPLPSEDEIKNVTSIQQNIEQLRQTVSQNQGDILGLTSVITKETQDVAEYKQQILTLLNGKKSKDVLIHLENVQKLEGEKKQIVNITSNLEQKISQAQRQVQILDKQEWVHTNADCKRCMFLQDAWKAKDELEVLIQKLSENTINLENNKNQLEEIGFSSQQLLQIERYVAQYNQHRTFLEAQQAALLAAQEAVKTNAILLEKTESELEKFQDLEQQLEENENIRNKIDGLKKEKSNGETLKLALERKVFDWKTQQARFEGQLDNIITHLQEILEHRKNIEYHEAYVKATDKKGLPFQIMTSLLPRINAEVNAMLASTQEWRVIIETEEDSLFVNIVSTLAGERCKRPIEAGSGSERAITAIALRAALTRISAIPKPNFLAFDESFHSLDPNSMAQMRHFLASLKSSFDFIILISHDSQMHDIVTHKLTVDASQGFSKLTL